MLKCKSIAKSLTYQKGLSHSPSPVYCHKMRAIIILYIMQ